jgi:hypothetical protein
VFRAVQFQNLSRSETDYVETTFHLDAEEAFKKVLTTNLTLQNSTLRGTVEEGEDGDDLLFLSVHLEVLQTSVPLDTVLQAAFGKGRPLPDVIRRGLNDAASAVLEMLHLVNAPPSRLIEALASSEADIQIFAAMLIGEKKVEGAGESLCRMLNDPKEEAADAAADALKKVGTTASVPLIIQSISKRELRSQVRAMEVIAAVGGSEARAYLEMTALGHEVPEVRALSQSLLKTMMSKDRP